MAAAGLTPLELQPKFSFEKIFMAYGSSRSVRFQDDLESSALPTINGGGVTKIIYNIDGTQIPELSGKRTAASRKSGRSLRAKVLSRVFSEDYERVQRKILDPRGQVIRRWNKIFLVACLISLFVDPLFFYLPVVRDKVCIDIGVSLEVVLTTIRSIADVFYTIQIFIKFRTAYVAPSSRVFGRGELVIDPCKIAIRYLRHGFWIDLIAAVPVPQVLIWIVIPNLSGSTMTNTKNFLRFFLIFQYFPRLFLIFPLSTQIVKATGLVTQTAWAGAAYNLILYMLASHEPAGTFFQLSDKKHAGEDFVILTNLVKMDFLIVISSLGQNLATSTFVGEIIFAIIVATLGLVLFALLIGNMQKYLQSTTVRLEEWRIRRTDTEQWMHHRQLPPELRQSVRRYDQYKWVATRGVDEEVLLRSLPLDLRRDIKRHLCLDLVRRVPLFDQMDERMLDAICERLKPALSTEGTFLVREGDPVNEMLFIIRGHLDSYTTNGGRTGFFNSCRIGPGDFCGEELLTWALDPRPSVVLPSSTRTVKAISEVEAFALIAEDLKFVSSQFRRLHSKQLRHKFRFYSHQWRTWAACFVQAAWRRYKRRKERAELRARESYPATKVESPRSPPMTSNLDSRSGNARRGLNKRCVSDAGVVSSLQKPEEPDFSIVEE
ncbi:putative cyclic nucleotide-gated ion channel 15 isoform X1 [Cucumis melo var. makuwa]|uniref:Putative cyclic nucleotide-gated ion channel 15 isoform X1 n=1 Tax=Cucumis melo var. makuwa TaxID=1194695 RepID=A0A5D3CRQ7_CUCMM|nr:putative cyclic nucleotide-gated ion channel 15 isoform X1 [Cucumis melo var. makuwa]